MKHFVGIDLHKDVSQMAVLRESKMHSQLRLANDVVTVERVLKKLPRIVGEDVELLGFINRQIGGLDKELTKIALEDAQSKRLMTIPGVGPVSAVAVSCWIGEIARFSNAKKLASYFGLAPRVRQSERHGHITKEGNRMVRSLVIQAALVHTRRGKGPSRKHYLGVLRRRGKQIARVAVANKMLGAIFHMMKEQIDYHEFLRRSGAQ
jgi:transposase